jgi:hypothetical protein
MGMYHSSSGKSHYAAFERKVAFSLKAEVVRDILMMEEKRRFSKSYQRDVTYDHSYDALDQRTAYLDRLINVTTEMQVDCIRTVLKEYADRNQNDQYDDDIALLTAASYCFEPPYKYSELDGRDPMYTIALVSYRNARFKYKDDPTMNSITVYQRQDRSRPGTLQVGDPVPKVNVVDLNGKVVPLNQFCSVPNRNLVLVCGSVS